MRSKFLNPAVGKLRFVTGQNVMIQLSISIKSTIKFQPLGMNPRFMMLNALYMTWTYAFMLQDSPYSHLGNMKMPGNPSHTNNRAALIIKMFSSSGIF
jgi:hypothetical protein